MFEKKNSSEEKNGRLDIIEEKISEPEDIATETIPMDYRVSLKIIEQSVSNGRV